MEIIPAIDLIDGKCVRLTHGNYDDKIVYHEDPLVAARMFEDAGLRRLHLVDLNGAKAGKVQHVHILERIAKQTSLIIDFGGGITSTGDLEKVFDAGAALATIGSLAVKNETLFTEWIRTYGPEKFFLGADVRDGKIAVSGWLEQTEITLMDFISKYRALGVHHIFCTDISRDGALRGPATELYRSIIKTEKNIKLVASGGVSTMEDLEALRDAGCYGAIVGKAIYEGRIGLDEIGAFNKGKKQ